MENRRPNFQPFKGFKVTDIFIGIDFGTSYTKVSFSYAPTNNKQINTVKWDGDLFKKSVLYLKDNRLYFDIPDGDFTEVKYFKYSIIEDKLKNTHVKTVNLFEEMCCVYFLAQVIKRSLTYIKNTLKIESLNNISISINMGVPLENFYDQENITNKGIYEDILNDAVLLAGGSKVKAVLPYNKVLISSLDDVYTEIKTKKAYLLWNTSVYPELAAELLLYQNSPLVPEGVYAIIDVGGGTVDMALFAKVNDGSENSMTCLKQKVLPYGVELLDKLEDASDLIFQEEFSEMLFNSIDNIDVNYDRQTRLVIFFLGGGANNNWYIRNILKTESRLSTTTIPKYDLSQDFNNFINEDHSLVEKNQRLIISQMLANHKSEITQVKGFPIYYDIEKTERKERNRIEHGSVTSLKDDLYELGQKYWD